MLLRDAIALRLRLLAMSIAILCAGPLTIVHGDVFASAAPIPHALVDGRAFVAALPSALRPPAVDPGLRLVSMIAADIDADGDLDVVASDGSLDLVVWTNDGTGRLTRKYPEPSSGDRAQQPAPAFSDHQTAAEGAVPGGGWACCLWTPARHGPVLVGRQALPSPPSRSPFAVSVRTPRAPPVSIL